jgi:hypothetical protein
VALPVTFRPLGVRIAAVAFGVLLFTVTAAIWFSFPDDVRAAFTPFQRITVLAMGAAVLVIGHALARCRIEAGEEGLRVVNGYRSHRLAWAQVVAVRMAPGNPWVVLDLADGTSLSALGIQGSDGARAERQVRTLRLLIDSHAAPEPGR